METSGRDISRRLALSPTKGQRAGDGLVAAIKAHILAALEHSKARSYDDPQPMIAALSAIGQAVDIAVCDIVEEGGFRGVPYTATWLVGSAHEWLEHLRDWEDKRFWPEINKAVDDLIDEEGE